MDRPQFKVSKKQLISSQQVFKDRRCPVALSVVDENALTSRQSLRREAKTQERKEVSSSSKEVLSSAE